LASEGVIIVDPQLKILGLDRGAKSILGRLLGYKPEGDSAILPAEIRELLGARLLSGNGSDNDETFHIGGREYTCSVFRVRSLSTVIPQQVVAVRLIRTTSVSNSLNKVAKKCGLTERESEVLQGISIGLSSKMLGSRMNISPNTVNAFLRMIMIKLGVTTRAGIVGKLLDVERGANGEGVRVTRRGVDNTGRKAPF
jgi:DNA-binding CsgD family transcriptional regulator